MMTSVLKNASDVVIISQGLLHCTVKYSIGVSYVV